MSVVMEQFVQTISARNSGKELKEKEEKKTQELKKTLDKIKEKSRGKSKKKKKNKTAVKFCVIHEKEVLASVHYLNPNLLSLFMNQKGFLNKGKFNSICSKHQRHLRKHIILSRHLHLLPYIVV